MQRILLATDGSSAASEATAEAIGLARELDLPLFAVSVEESVLPLRTYHGSTEVVAKLERLEAARVRRVLADTARAAAAAGVICEAAPARGLVVDAICRLAEEHGARVVVVGDGGRHGIRRATHGNVASRLSRRARCPVLIVPRRPSARKELS